MGWIRIAIIIMVVWLLWYAFRHFGEKVIPPKKPRPIGNMVKCNHCGVHVPEQEAIKHGEHTYCCIAHRQAEQNTDNQ